MERLARGRGPKGGCNVKVGQGDEQEEQRQGGGLWVWRRGGGEGLDGRRVVRGSVMVMGESVGEW